MELGAEMRDAVRFGWELTKYKACEGWQDQNE